MKDDKPITQKELTSQLRTLRKDMTEDISNEMNRGFGLVAEGFGKVMDRIEETRAELKGEFYAFRHEMREEIADIKASLKRLEGKTREDDSAIVFEVSSLRKRVDRLERELKRVTTNLKRA